MLVMALTALFISNPLAVQGLRTTSGSPCAEQCSKLGGSSSNTTVSEIVCLDSQYNQTKGRDFEDCIKCELESTYVDRLSGETDVNWGLCMSIAYDELLKMSLIGPLQSTSASLSRRVSFRIPH